MNERAVSARVTRTSRDLPMCFPLEASCEERACKGSGDEVPGSDLDLGRFVAGSAHPAQFVEGFREQFVHEFQPLDVLHDSDD